MAGGEGGVMVEPKYVQIPLLPAVTSPQYVVSACSWTIATHVDPNTVPELE